MKRTSIVRSLSRALAIASLSTTLLFLAYFVLAITFSPLAYRVASENLSEPLLVRRVPILLISYPIIIPVSIQGEFILFTLLALYSLILVKTVFNGVGINQLLSELSELDLRFLLKNSFALTTLATCLTILAMLSITFIQESLGIPTGELTFPNPAWKYLTLIYSPINEEFGFRLTFIGLFLTALYSSITRKIHFKKILLGLIYPATLMNDLEGELRNRFRRGAWILIFLSAISFGILHYFSVGWEIGKVSSASLAGLLLGYLYVFHGFPSSVTSHLMFNFLPQTSTLLSEKYSFFALIDGLIVIHGLLASLIFLLSLGARSHLIQTHLPSTA